MGRSMTAAPLSKSGRDKSRSEEHTSELQSQSNLVCRLLLEKKKNHFAADVARHGKFLGYQASQCHALAVFATRARFPAAHEAGVCWHHPILPGAPADVAMTL